MSYLLKQLAKGLGLCVVGPVVGAFTFLSKHWLLNSIFGTLIAVIFPFQLPIILSTAIGYTLSATIIGSAQQLLASLYNFNLGQCEMMYNPLVPEVSYAALKGIQAANLIAAKAESYYQNKEIYDVNEQDIWYGERVCSLLLFSAGHLRCAQRGCKPYTWDLKEQKSRKFSFS